MVSLYTVPPGGVIGSQDIDQLVLTLTGQQNTPVNVKTTDPIAYTFQGQNTDPAGKTLLLYGPDGTTVILRSQANGVVASPDGTAAAPVVTTTHAQTLTNKTFTAPVLTTPHFTSPVIDSGALTLAATGIATPAATDLVLSPGAGGVVRPNLNYLAVNSSANTAVAAGTTVDLNPGLLFTLAAGTWLLLGHWVALDTSAAANLMTGYIRDGANATIATHTNTAVASGYGGGPLLAVVTPAVSTGYKISVNATGNATAQSGTSSGLVAIRLA